ncbi:MAG TPA: GDSL-type esterase/lipase family protein [Methylomusa anaerophila]|uniref:SGNH hydrolase-type esterase domain-containing protein n=1 Tax=Methylomusa anaerophila TaxID=1930071 RepID=A0A348ANM9_9FIRM|nr:GDSL-type esterase/lipase family protein [Methylomusa anaerophila]BBB92677.1 hypothetical protein MAMMFC1_03372 [Methylomusa anaerophila]HML87470.1 GDSL-type esterase/lipase family protein [Methylomusa anaerophila]
MKRLLMALVLLAALLYAVEAIDWFGLNQFKPLLTINTVANEYILSWSRLPYPVYYEVEVFSAPPREDINGTGQIITKYRTLDTRLVIKQNFPFHTFWRVSAHSLFHHPLGRCSDTLKFEDHTGQELPTFDRIKPVPTIHYPYNLPASSQPMFTWTVVPGAVYYELELLSAFPENPNGIKPSRRHQLKITREVFTNGYNADLSWYEGNHLFWRVRALNNKGNPIGVFSDAAEVFIDHSLQMPLKPLLNQHQRKNVPPPLYPAYSWIPVQGAARHEVELLSQPPENPNGIDPSRYRLWSAEVAGAFDCYDEEPRIIPGRYYWRVRGIDNDGNPVGVYSDIAEFTVDLSRGNYAATFGDSITHGGGAISYSPADCDYSYQTYLYFPAVNLGKSGDTSETMLDRFDRDVLPFKPKFLLILGGTNSLRGGTPARQVIDELAAIRDNCLVNGIRPIFLTLPPINPTAIHEVFQEETVPDWQKEFAAVNQFIRAQQYYIELEPFFTDAGGELPDHFAIDGLHLDIEGKKLMAQIINANWSRVIR